MKPMNGFSLYLRYLRIGALGTVQYRMWWVRLVQVLFVCVTDPLEILVLFSLFRSIGSFTLYHVLAIYGLAVSAFGAAETLGRGFDTFPSLIRSGGFDRVLLRPRGLYVQVVAHRFHLHRLVRAATGLAMFLIGLRHLGGPVPPLAAACLALAYAGGVCAYVGVFVFSAALCFYTIGSVDITYIFTNGSYQLAKMPPEALPAWLRGVFTFLVPMFVFCYYPVSYACGMGASALSAFAALPAGALFLLLALCAFSAGARRYASTGS